ncbi:hypothetical protein [Nitrosomonas sp. Nm58]|uniref:hypothetical protein n=1 Tax=Nitrosomonas sp. Nm58 TaxID=200126 RepID=UPI000898648A|nr:hypothetical protein [Nitrosomonas sp. Nm58]SDZ01976.1 hypothetical protein SAMN05421754_104314 [Nitrosomonas sp. Nm58]
MNWTPVLISLFMIVGPVAAMQIEADPRSIASFMDKSLTPELDILQVATDISADNHLVFQVKTRGEQINGKNSDYLLLQILHEKTYLLLLPLNKEEGDKILIYEGTLQPENHKLSKITGEFKEYNLSADFTAKRIVRGAEFTVPLDWINYGADFNFDAYTIQASMQGNTLQINKVYDQARKGRKEEKRFSAITLLNKICSPKKR